MQWEKKGTNQKSHKNLSEEEGSHPGTVKQRNENDSS